MDHLVAGKKHAKRNPEVPPDLGKVTLYFVGAAYFLAIAIYFSTSI